MGETIKRELILEGLGCPNCAAKIEQEVRNIECISDASLDFISKKLTIEVDPHKECNALIGQISKIAKRLEGEIEVVENKDVKVSEDKYSIVSELLKPKTIVFLIGAILFAAAFILKLPFWFEFIIYLLSYILIGSEVVIKAFKNIIRGSIFDENFLMAVATIGAFAIKEFSEAVAVMLFYQIGEFFQDVAVNRSRKSISALMNIRPDYANLKLDQEVKKVSPEEVSIGDIIIIKPGEKVPLDGKVLEGHAMLDTSALTGESVPREVNSGSEILSGSININGLLTVEVTKSFAQSTVSKILELVENAGSRKAPTENFITKFARYYTPVVVFCALGLALIPPLILPGTTFAYWINRALIFLVVSCPCALVISIPLGFFGGIGGASKNGILVKGGNYLEALNNVDTVVFDKTGTLTKGVFKVTKINNMCSEQEDTLLEYAAYAECYSNHPIATSILNAYSKEVDKEQIEDYEEIAGHGIRVKFKGKEILTGNSRLMSSRDISVPDTDEIGTIVHIAVDGNYAGYIVISDEIKEDSKSALHGLKALGVKKLVMLTGDAKAIADKIGRELGLDEVYSELLPDQKVQQLEVLDKQKQSKGRLLFVGDGINDAPVLTRADVGIAMGGVGSDAAIEAADVVLMTDEPSKLVSAIRIAKRTRNIVWQNIIFALGIKILVLVLAGAGIANMWEAVFADVGVALIAVLNSIRTIKV